MIVPNIIRNKDRQVIVDQLLNELQRQGITEYKLWDSITLPHKPRRTGISKAHKAIVEWALLEQLPEVCIWESDVWFPSPNGWRYFVENKPENYSLYLAGVTRGEINERNVTKRYTGQFCYFVNESFYTTFLGVNEDCDIDGAMSGLGNFVVCNPFAAFCYPGWSDNAQGIMDYSHLLIGRDIYGFGKMNNKEDAKRFSDLATSMKPK